LPYISLRGGKKQGVFIIFWGGELIRRGEKFFALARGGGGGGEGKRGHIWM